MTLEKTPCPICGELIYVGATKCYHCGDLLDKGRFGAKGKTAWDWARLLVVPLTIVVLGSVLSLIQSCQESNREAKRAADQAQLQATTEASRANANLLQSYLDDMFAILLTEDLENPSPKAKTTARTRTVAILNEMDAKRNQTVLQFLRDAKTDSYILEHAILKRADLREADLRGFTLSSANLTEADLTDAKLGGAYLFAATLTSANLSGVDLFGADLTAAILSDAKYTKATIWPQDFDLVAAGAILVDDEGNPIDDSK